MRPNEKLGRSIMNMVDSIKDSVSAKISEAVASGQIRIDPGSLPALIALVSGTIDSGYHKAARVLEREIASALSTQPLRSDDFKKKGESR